MCSVDPAARELAWRWQSRLDGQYLTRELPERDRHILLDRHLVLDTALKEQNDGEVTALVAEMLQVYFRRPAPPQTYAYVLRQTVPAPLWASVDAINRVRRGEIGNPDFAPFPGRLRAIAWDIARPFWAERKMIISILAAKPPRPLETSERRRKVASRILGEWHNSLNSQHLATVSGDIGASSCGVSEESCKPLELPDF